MNTMKKHQKSTSFPNLYISAGTQFLDHFNALDPGALPLHHARIFCEILQNGSMTYREIEEKFSLSNASASRVVNSLSNQARHRQTSLGLVEIYIDPEEGRRYRAKASKKGKMLGDSLVNTLSQLDNRLLKF